MGGGTDSKSLKHFIAGQWVDAAAGAMFEVFNPLDDSHYAFAAKGTTEDIFNAVAAAKTAFASYKETTLDDDPCRRRFVSQCAWRDDPI